MANHEKSDEMQLDLFFVTRFLYDGQHFIGSPSSRVSHTSLSSPVSMPDSFGAKSMRSTQMGKYTILILVDAKLTDGPRIAVEYQIRSVILVSPILGCRASHCAGRHTSN